MHFTLIVIAVYKALCWDIFFGIHRGWGQFNLKAVDSGIYFNEKFNNGKNSFEMNSFYSSVY
jgi:hypothetical protein